MSLINSFLTAGVGICLLSFKDWIEKTPLEKCLGLKELRNNILKLLRLYIEEGDESTYIKRFNKKIDLVSRLSLDAVRNIRCFLKDVKFDDTYIQYMMTDKWPTNHRPEKGSRKMTKEEQKKEVIKNEEHLNQFLEDHKRNLFKIKM